MVWAYTVQRFPPKSPPYVVPAEGFTPYAVGYVELPEGIKIEAILDCDDFADLDRAPVRLVAATPRRAPGCPREIGDAQVKGPSLFVGYARGGIPAFPGLTADGFLPTGDLVEVAADGSIRVMGRKKQIIIRGGRNIDINEMEAAIAALPGMVQVCVVPVPDELLGERAAALVVTEGAEPTLDTVADRLAAAGFPKFKWPEYLFPVADLPQNRVGKLSRPDAVRLAAEPAAADPSSSQVG